MSRITCADLAEAARAGDTFACVELDKIAESFSIALANILAAQGVDTAVSYTHLQLLRTRQVSALKVLNC